MSKIFIFVLLWRLIGNPIVAVLVLLVVLYLLDRRFIGLTPSLLRPFKKNMRLAAIRRDLARNPHDTRSKAETARLLIEKKRYREAQAYLEEVLPLMDDSAEVLVDLGLCKLMAGQTDEGESLMLRGLELNPRVHYGEPYLLLAEVFSSSHPQKALDYMQEALRIHSSSCEAYYRLGRLYDRMRRKDDAQQAYRDAVQGYRMLPKYKRRTERRWMLLARWRMLG